MKNRTCCFIGHRDIPPTDLAQVLTRTETKIRELLSVGYNRFCVGGGVGYDTEAAKILMRMKATEFFRAYAIGDSVLGDPDPDDYFAYGECLEAICKFIDESLA